MLDNPKTLTSFLSYIFTASNDSPKFGSKLLLKYGTKEDTPATILKLRKVKLQSCGNGLILWRYVED